MDRNLGATRVAEISNDFQAYGDLYQWGRNADGHEKITWTSATVGTPVNGMTSTRPNADQAATPEFIAITSGNFDWRGTTQNDNLWQGVTGTNNPCPAGFRVPTNTELTAEVAEYTITNSTSAFASPLKFTVTGLRDTSGVILSEGSIGYYWTSTVNASRVAGRNFSSTGTLVNDNGRAGGLAVRCIKQQ
jgi:hypothetical protein